MHQFIEYFRLIRIKHWLKNIIVFLPLFFSNNLNNLSKITNLLLSYFIFCFVSSFIYIYNDIKDIKEDQNHPIKKQRPIASGKISLCKAKKISIFIILIAFILIHILYEINSNIYTIFIPFVYLILNILYSNFFKKIPIIDILIIVSGFLLRVAYGGISISVEVSKYLYLTILFGGFFVGFGKRRNEILKNKIKSREVLEIYSKDFLDKNMYVSLTLAIVSYTLWCVDYTTITRIGNDSIFWTIPLLMVILQKYSLIIEGDSHGDPIEVILSDKIMLLLIAIFSIIMFILLYL